jgi:AAA domain
MPTKIDEPDTKPPRLTILNKGESGSGKSIQAASFPEVYFFDFDQRFDAVKNFFSKNGPHPKTDIYYDKYEWTEYHKAFKVLEEFVQYGCPYKTLVFDTTSTIIMAIHKYIKTTKGQVATDKNKDSYGMDLSLGLISVPALDDYKFLLKGFEQLMQTAKSIPNVHIIFNAHLSTIQERKGSTTVTRTVLAPGQTANAIPLHFNEVFHMDIESGILSSDKTKRIIVTESGGEDFARTTLPLPARMDVTDVLLYDRLKQALPSLEQTENLEVKVKTPFKV